jgi:hypothetical protein
MDSVNDELQRRINEHVLNGDAPSIIWAMEGQIRINTELEVRIAELERREALLTATIDELDKWVGGRSRWWEAEGSHSLLPPELLRWTRSRLDWMVGRKLEEGESK